MGGLDEPRSFYLSRRDGWLWRDTDGDGVRGAGEHIGLFAAKPMQAHVTLFRVPAAWHE